MRIKIFRKNDKFDDKFRNLLPKEESLIKKFNQYINYKMMILYIMT